MKKVAPILVLLLTAAVYWPALQAGFVGDDFMILYRLRPVADLGDALRFFRGEFFEYYRPLAFVSHAIDWLIAGANAWQFHFTNLLLHLANTLLVFAIARAIVRHDLAAIAAALLFGLHASNHEAVIWMSARFDLLATFWSLLALAMVIGGAGGQGAGGPEGRRAGGLGPGGLAAAVTYFLALLSKESAVALPIAVAAWAVFRLRATTRDAIVFTAPWLIALAVYSVLRNVAGGIPATGGAGRLPKLIVFGVALMVVLAAADSRWLRVRDWLRTGRLAAAAALALTIALALALAALAPGAIGSLVRAKLAVAGFAVFYLLSPIVDVAQAPHFLDPATRVYWIGGVAAVAVAVLLVIASWHPLVDDESAWFAGALLLGTLLPISALTEGKRYLYLPSAATALLAAIVLVRLRARAARLAGIVVAIVVAVSAWQITRKAADWVWAGRMTQEGAAMVDAALAPRCGGHVVFLTSPVAVRGVYTHFYYETFELPRGCRPDVFQVLLRVIRLDTTVEVRWDGPERVVITSDPYARNFVASRDLRHFDLPLRATRAAAFRTPLGEVRTEAMGSMQRVELTLDPSLSRDDVKFFYYSDGRVHALKNGGAQKTGTLTVFEPAPPKTVRVPVF